MVDMLNNSLLRHYMPDQVLIVAQHAQPLSLAEFLDRLRQAVAESGDGNLRRLLAAEPLYGERFNPIQRNNPDSGGLRHFTLLPLTLGIDPDDYATPALMTQAFYANKAAINTRLADANNAFQIEAIMPNWMSVPAPSGVADGGPGSIAVPVQPQGDEYDFEVIEIQQDKVQIEAIGKLKDALLKRQQGQPVKVVILDAFPDQTVVDNAYITWSAHPVLSGLQSALQPIRSVPFMDNSLEWVCGAEPMDGYLVNKHFYPMPDHGIFVAGIIHSLAPLAELYPIRVLNRYGVGTIDSVAQGLEAALRLRQSGEDLLINMSLTFTFPYDDKHRRDGLSEPLLQVIDENAESMMAAIEWLRQELAFSPESTATTYLLAAAGNDWDHVPPLPEPRFPAALPEVIGVGAFNKTFDPTRYFFARYTNKADWPRGKGISVFGGNARQRNQTDEALEADPELGMLGVFVSSHFPHADDPCGNGDPNGNGWARWAGTSFATPVVTGVLALLRQQGNSLAQAEAIIRAAAKEHLKDDPTAEVEDLLPIQQKFGPQLSNSSESA